MSAAHFSLGSARRGNCEGTWRMTSRLLVVLRLWSMALHFLFDRSCGAFSLGGVWGAQQAYVGRFRRQKGLFGVPRGSGTGRRALFGLHGPASDGTPGKTNKIVHLWHGALSINTPEITSHLSAGIDSAAAPRLGRPAVTVTGSTLHTVFVGM